MEKDAGSKTELKKKKKKHSLMDAAFELFTEQGFGNTSISDIVERAKVAKGTFYLYFKDKYDLRTIITMHKAEQVFLKAWEEAGIKKDMEFEDVVLELSSSIIDILAKDKTLTFFLVKNLSFGVFQREDKNREGLDFHAMVHEILEHSQKKYRDPEILLFLLFEFLGSASYSSVIEGVPVPITELKPHLLDTLKGILKMYEC
ncbi:MAG: helix-turn-helix transcriptional regulator [Lachnospiraceae bacterium]|nr:helix-turn-helix transcriptional regulator [Lachnospiraceae bacterium]